MLIYIVGIFICSGGVTLSISTNLGISPINSLPYIISEISGISLGACVSTVFFTYILAQIIILKKEFKPIQFLQIFSSILFGFFVDFFEVLFSGIVLTNYFERMGLLGVSVFFIALGNFLFVNVKFIMMPFESLVIVLLSIFKKYTYGDLKVRLDTLTATTSIILSLTFLHELKGIREGTIISALTVGFIIKKLEKILLPLINKICFGNKVEN